jgi:hypothetical protein
MPSETFYHAYLPPPTLPPLSLPGDGVTFHRIHLAPSLAGKIVERDEDAEDEGGKRISRQPDVAVESLPSDDAGNALGPRARRSSHHEPDPDVSSRSSDRRRSKRLRLSGACGS